MPHVTRELINLGFSNSEARVWQAALELGDADVASLARIAGMPRTSIYGTLETLISKGLLNFYVKKRRRYYVPVPPERLIAEFSAKEEAARKILPLLRAAMRKQSAAPQITLHEGVGGIQTVFRHIIETKQHFLAITSLDDFDAIANRHFRKFVEERVSHHLRVRLITNRSDGAKKYAQRDAIELRETRVVPETFRFHTANYVFGDYVAMLSLRQTPPFAVLIHDGDIAETHRMYFELLWERAQKLDSISR